MSKNGSKKNDNEKTGIKQNSNAEVHEICRPCDQLIKNKKKVHSNFGNINNINPDGDGKGNTEEDD